VLAEVDQWVCCMQRATRDEITGIQEGMWAEVDFLKALFSTRGVLIAVYILIGVFLNTAPPHLPTTPSSVASLHSWVQYIISVFFWPLGLWHPTFILGKWTP
jgi:hypothetical protein